MTNDPKNPKDQEKPVEQKKGGFGAFADKYRDRWAANHPSTKKEDSQATPAADRQDARGTVNSRPTSP